MILIPTEYKGVHNGFAYTIHLGYKERGWIVHRRREENNPIPPFLSVWTEKGWVPVLSGKAHDAKEFESLGAASRMIEEQTDE